MPAPLEPELGAGGRSKGRQIRDPAEASFQPVGHVAAASARNGESGGEISDRKLRQDEGDHHEFGDLVMHREHDDGLRHAQPEHDGDHAQAPEAVRHPRQRLYPGEKCHGKQRRPDQRHVKSRRPQRQERRRQPQARHGDRAIEHRPARQRGGRHRQREQAGGIHRLAGGEITGEAEAEHRQEEDERRHQGREDEKPHAHRAFEVDGRPGREDEELDDPQGDEVAPNGDQAPAIPSPEFPGDCERGSHVPTRATNASSSVRYDSWMVLSGALSAILPWLIIVT